MDLHSKIPNFHLKMSKKGKEEQKERKEEKKKQ